VKSRLFSVSENETAVIFSISVVNMGVVRKGGGEAGDVCMYVCVYVCMYVCM